MVAQTGRSLVQQTVQVTLLGLPDGAIDGSDEGMEVGDANGFELSSVKGPGEIVIGASESGTEVSAEGIHAWTG